MDQNKARLISALWMLWWFTKQPARSVCGECGTTKSNKNGFCIKGHDYWIEAEDFNDPELQGYIDNAYDSREELKKKLGMKGR